MKTINLNRLLMITLIVIFSGYTSAAADGFAKEETEEQDRIAVNELNNVEIDDIFCLKADPTQVFVIIDQYDRIITQGKCTDVMVQFFLKISDPLLFVDNIRYYRLGYDNMEIIQQRLFQYNREFTD